MKRYIRPQFGGLGIGRKLAELCVKNAKQNGFQYLMLDTLYRLTEALFASSATPALCRYGLN